MKLLNLLPSILFAASVNVLFAGSPVNQNLLNAKGWSFVENKGQLADDKGQLLTDVKYYSHDGGPQIYCRPGTVSFVFSKTVNEAGQEVDLFQVPKNPQEAMD